VPNGTGFSKLFSACHKGAHRKRRVPCGVIVSPRLNNEKRLSASPKVFFLFCAVGKERFAGRRQRTLCRV